MQKQLTESKKTITNLQNEIDHLKDVIEELVAITTERIQIERCSLCGYYKRTGKEISSCSNCDTSICKDCQDDAEPCCSGSSSEESSQ
jgi:hypothetical protein